ncbi:hypothetical protein FBU31_006183, partial [Coemansia sp. 'formosensis']
YVKANNLDGIDIDWEYPGRLGDNCNVFDVANDTPNYLKFLQSLRAAMDTAFGTRQKMITLAVRVQPFDINGVPSTDVSAFAKVVDYANLMQYDINGGWNNVTGPNAPFNFQQGEGLQVSFVSAINDWIAAGFPANQLTAGIGFYGRSTIALEDMTKDPTNQYQPQSQLVPLGDSEDAPWYDVCAGTTANSGVWQWKHLRDQGVLTSPGAAAAPWVRQWDSVSQTPWLFNPSTKQFISYDDPQSLQVKINYAASKGLAGAMVWSANMDYNNELMNVLHSWPSGPVVTTSPPATTSATSSAPGTSNTAASTSPTACQTPTSATTTTMSTSTMTTASSTPVGNGPVAGSACASAGMYQCANSSGNAPGYFLCLYGKWVAQSCGSGTAVIDNVREMLSTTVDVSQIIPQGYEPNWFERTWLSMFDGRNELLTFTVIAFLMHEAVYFGRYLPFLVCDYIPAFRKYKIQGGKEVTAAMQWKCLKSLLFSHFIIEGPLMLGFLPVAKLAGIRTTEVPLPGWAEMAVQIAVFF